MTGSKKCTKCGEIKSLDEFHNMASTYDGKRPSCKECRKPYSSVYYKNNAAKVADRCRKWREDNKESLAGKKLKYRIDNAEKIAIKNANYYRKNKAQIAVKGAIYRKENKERIKKRNNLYAKENRALRNAHHAKRKANKLKATPAWADDDVIKSLYAFSRFLTLTTFGDGYHVDHIVPLQGKNVCGLHVEDNLTILRAKDNLSKGNRFV